MRTICTAFFYFALFATNASAQSPVGTGRITEADVSLGYSYVRYPVSQSNQVGLNGVDASATVGFYSWMGISGEVGYSRAANVLGTASHSDVLSYLVGPVFYPATHRNLQTYVHALLGGARVSGPAPVTGGFLIDSWTNNFAWEAGGGLEYQVTDTIAVRTGVDYLRTGFFGPSQTVQGQNNIKATVAVVYLFGGHRRQRR
jgi:opacity protein-like surface antigen